MSCKIAHIADIHIRTQSRHDEIRIVFSEFVKQCKQQKIDHIYIGGDIYHTKTQGISPEYIDLMHWWLSELTSYGAQVHMILGNHDGALTNLSRQDAITPIVNAVNNPNVHLYKNSGVFEFTPGYTFCVFSLFDEENWSKVEPMPGKINIACYHGPVDGSSTETDWAIESTITSKFFDKYDFAFLGDIHRTQFLDYRDVEIEINEEDLHLYEGAEIVS